MFEKLDELIRRYEDIGREVEEPAVLSDPSRYAALMKEQSVLKPLADTYARYQACKKNIADSEELLPSESDEEMRALLKEELAASKEELPKLEQELKLLLLPRDEKDDRSVIVEIRAGTGGDEAALFAGELYRMYAHYAESRHWKVEILDSEEIGIGGMKNISFTVNGQGAWSRLKYESGVHRVQRVPVTESGGRIHTSAASVAIMPEVDDVEVHLDPNDCDIDTYRSSGAGGQHINKTSSAIRITHRPTGIVVTCQNERSQLQNKEEAFRVLRARLYEIEQEKQTSEEAALRKSQVGTGDRSEKIRTYNFPQGRVTDHRIKLTLYRIDQILDGDLDEIIDALITADQAIRLSRMEEREA
ncbi:MAG: peptide chain release factor 1 [Lachnospiraceae bacterium]|nr:peptide chain release factor 1 [Lachnospiraceae bacterium]